MSPIFADWLIMLHVGIFRPCSVRTTQNGAISNIRGHEMSREWCSSKQETHSLIRNPKELGNNSNILRVFLYVISLLPLETQQRPYPDAAQCCIKQTHTSEGRLTACCNYSSWSWWKLRNLDSLIYHSDQLSI